VSFAGSEALWVWMVYSEPAESTPHLMPLYSYSQGRLCFTYRFLWLHFPSRVPTDVTAPLFRHPLTYAVSRRTSGVARKWLNENRSQVCDGQMRIGCLHVAPGWARAMLWRQAIKFPSNVCVCVCVREQSMELFTSARDTVTPQNPGGGGLCPQCPSPATRPTLWSPFPYQERWHPP
jgi:hypothetical protein